LLLGGMQGTVPLCLAKSLISSESYALSASRFSATGKSVSNGIAQGESAAWPGVSLKETGNPRASTATWILVELPPLERPMA
jgi:hypothetical protein